MLIHHRPPVMADLIGHMNWSVADLVAEYSLFKQRCKLLFSVRDIKKEKQVDYILLLIGTEGMERYNSWALTGDAAKDSKTVWEKFKQCIEPRHNFRVGRLFLQKIHQEDDENIDTFVSRPYTAGQEVQIRHNRKGTDPRRDDCRDEAHRITE